jgi:hypothetical protein
MINNTYSHIDSILFCKAALGGRTPVFTRQMNAGHERWPWHGSSVRRFPFEKNYVSSKEIPNSSVSLGFFHQPVIKLCRSPALLARSHEPSRRYTVAGEPHNRNLYMHSSGEVSIPQKCELSGNPSAAEWIG